MSGEATERGFESPGPRRPCSVIETCMHHESESVFTVGDHRRARLRGRGRRLAGGGGSVSAVPDVTAPGGKTT